MMKEQIDEIRLCRSQPVQGKPVLVKFYWNEQFCGNLALLFTGWIKLQRLLQKGVELDGRENHQLKVRLKVEGLEQSIAQNAAVTRLAPQRERFATPANLETPLSHPQPPSPLSQLSDKDDDPDIAAAEYAATVAWQLEEQPELNQDTGSSVDAIVRSLRPEGGEKSE